MGGRYGSLIRFTLACLAIFLILWLLGPGNTFISWIQAASEISAMEKQIENYKTQTEALDSRIEDLTTNRDSLEKFAREHFYFAAPGEDVYIIKERPNKKCFLFSPLGTFSVVLIQDLPAIYFARRCSKNPRRTSS